MPRPKPSAAPNGNQVAAWLQKLVRIPSVSPEQAGPRAGETGEGRIADAVARWFEAFGGEVYREEVLPGRPNIYGLWHSEADHWKAVDVHLDTVGVEQMTGDPFDGRIAGGRVHGRGSVDTKATLAVVLALLESLHRAGQRPPGNLLVAATIDEECGFRGAMAFVRWARARGITPDELAVAEPTLCAPIHAHKGTMRPVLEVHGVPAHASQPESGKNAITAAAHLLLAIDEEHARLQGDFAGKRDGLHVLGPAQLTATLISGGSGENIVPDSCRITVDRRLVAGEQPDVIAEGLRRLARQHCPLPVTVHEGVHSLAFVQSPESPWIRRLAAWSGKAPATAPYGTNAAFYGGFARECCVIGPGSIAQAHGSEEWIEIAELEKITAIYRRWWGLEVEKDQGTKGPKGKRTAG